MFLCFCCCCFGKMVNLVNWWFDKLCFSFDKLNLQWSEHQYAAMLPLVRGFLGGTPRCSGKPTGEARTAQFSLPLGPAAGECECSRAFPTARSGPFLPGDFSLSGTLPRTLLALLTLQCTCELHFLSFNQNWRLSEMAMPHPTSSLQPQTWCLAHCKFFKSDYWING